MASPCSDPAAASKRGYHRAFWARPCRATKTSATSLDVANATCSHFSDAGIKASNQQAVFVDSDRGNRAYSLACPKNAKTSLKTWQFRPVLARQDRHITWAGQSRQCFRDLLCVVDQNWLARCWSFSAELQLKTKTPATNQTLSKGEGRVQAACSKHTT